MDHVVNRVHSIIYEWRSILGMVIWDAIVGVAFICLLYLALLNLESTLTRTGVMLFAVALILLSVAAKYLLYYGKMRRDDVTGGWNKKEFERVSDRLLKGEGEFVVVYANVDRFKLINDVYGDDVGDAVLKEIHQVIDAEMLRWDEVSGQGEPVYGQKRIYAPEPGK